MAQPEEALWVAVPAAAVAAWGSAALMRRAAIRKLWERPATPVGQLQRGRVARIEGYAQSVDRALSSPIRGLPCVAYNAYVEYLDGDSPHRVPRWFEAANETRVAPFRIEGDDGHTIVVDSARFDVELMIPELERSTDASWDRLEPVLRRAGDPRLLRGRTLGYVEVAITPGTRVTLVGRVLRPPVGGAGAYRRAARDAELGPATLGGAIRMQLVGVG